MESEEGFEGSFVELLGCKSDDDVEKFLFSPPSTWPQMLHFGGNHDQDDTKLLCDSSSLSTLSCTPPSATSNKSSRVNAMKKPKATQGTIKVRRMLGARVTALHQLVSPYGKSDMATVLQEAIGYIKFLHGQLQVLSSPYFQSQSYHHEGGGGDGQKEGDLRSLGLCLVPVSCTEKVANSDGAVAEIGPPLPAVRGGSPCASS